MVSFASSNNLQDGDAALKFGEMCLNASVTTIGIVDPPGYPWPMTDDSPSRKIIQIIKDLMNQPKSEDFTFPFMV
jgi:hypothetical protein